MVYQTDLDKTRARVRKEDRQAAQWEIMDSQSEAVARTLSGTRDLSQFLCHMEGKQPGLCASLATELSELAKTDSHFGPGSATDQSQALFKQRKNKQGKGSVAATGSTKTGKPKTGGSKSRKASQLSPFADWEEQVSGPLVSSNQLGSLLTFRNRYIFSSLSWSHLPHHHTLYIFAIMTEREDDATCAEEAICLFRWCVGAAYCRHTCHGSLTSRARILKDPLLYIRGAHERLLGCSIQKPLYRTCINLCWPKIKER
jgi:hypothetical protein